MSRVAPLSLLLLATLLAGPALFSACVVTNANEGEGEGEGEEGEGEGEGEEGPEDTEAACSDGFSNDDDAFVDCDDFDCQDTEVCNQPEDNCSDGQDNNGNSFVDCQDFTCDADPACAEDCANGLDDDGDTRADCADGGCAADPACDAGVVSIQDIQDGTVGAGAVATIDDVIVTVVDAGDSGVSLFLQEPDGVTTGSHTYPEYAGMSFYVGSSFVATFPDLGTIAVGDCVTTKGEVSEREGGTQLFFISEFAKSTGCGAAPTPVVVPLADIATDTDPDTANDQAGIRAEAFEGVLVEVQNVTVSAAPDTNGNFKVSAGGDETLLISDFLLTSTPNVTASQTFASIRGVFNQYFGYSLQPRASTDLTP